MFPNPFPITKANSWMRVALFPSFLPASPSWVTVLKPFIPLKEISSPQRNSSEHQRGQARCSPPHGVGHQIDTLSTLSSPRPTDGLPNNIRSRRPGAECHSWTLTPRVSPQHKLLEIGWSWLSITEQPRVSPLAPNFQGVGDQSLAEH